MKTLLKKLKRALGHAEYQAFISEEAAAHYGESFNQWDSIVCRWNGFKSGWKGEQYPDIDPNLGTIPPGADKYKELNKAVVDLLKDKAP